MVGDECSIGEQSTIAPHVRIYPFKRVETGAHVQRSLVWQPRGASTLFTDEGVTGIVNVDITPETATRLAMAFGTTLRSGERSSQPRRSPGLADDQAGDDRRDHRDRRVGRGPPRRDRGRQPLRGAGTRPRPGGFHVQISDRDPERIQIMFFEGDGTARERDDAQGRREVLQPPGAAPRTPQPARRAARSRRACTRPT